MVRSLLAPRPGKGSPAMLAERVRIFSLTATAHETAQLRRLIASLRAFGGAWGDCPIWLFDADPVNSAAQTLAAPGVTVLPLARPGGWQPYILAGKVAACAQAEALAPAGVQTLLWFNPDCLVLQPPALFDLGTEFDVAIRPVHVRNVGLPAGTALNHYWQQICDTVGVPGIRGTVESFVEAQPIYAYFNTHVYAINPTLGLGRRWLHVFQTLVNDRAYQVAACQALPPQIFLHQAVFSVLIDALPDPQRLRLLPPTYSYPYNLQQAVPPARRAARLNDLVCIAYEERSLDPRQVSDIAIDEPLAAWLLDRLAGS